jgi:succinyl-CoA synthetase alpha subunit
MALTKITHKGRDIVVADFSNKQGEELVDCMRQFTQNMIAEAKPQRILMDQTNIVMSKEIAAMQKVEAAKTDAYQEKLALIGISGIQTVVAHSIMSLVQSNVRMFDTTEEALDWLAE